MKRQNENKIESEILAGSDGSIERDVVVESEPLPTSPKTNEKRIYFR